METLTQPLREEHKELLPYIERIRQLAETIDQVSISDLRQGLEKVYHFLAHHLGPHAEAEEAALYPAVQRLLGCSEATQTMSRDHVEIRGYIEELATLRQHLMEADLKSEQIEPLRRVLYGVYALIKVHFAKEEEIYLPLLDRGLTSETAQEMFAAMEAAAHRAKHAAGLR